MFSLYTAEDGQRCLMPLCDRCGDGLENDDGGTALFDTRPEAYEAVRDSEWAHLDGQDLCSYCHARVICALHGHDDVWDRCAACYDDCAHRNDQCRAMRRCLRCWSVSDRVDDHLLGAPCRQVAPCRGSFCQNCRDFDSAEVLTFSTAWGGRSDERP